jgi:hypothetical protein
MTTTNFVIANIKLLIEISEDGNYRIHENRTHMDFYPCAYEDLPPIRKNEDGENVMQSILEMVSASASSSSNKIKWENEENEENDDDDDDDDDEEEDADDAEEDLEKEKEEEPEPRVYNSELLNRKPKHSLTTTLKNNYVKNNITKKQR